MLNRSLEHLESELRFALDETPINPDSPILSAYTANRVVPISLGMGYICTLLPILYGIGNVLTSLLLQIFKSLLVDISKFNAANNLWVAATENAQQPVESWLHF